MNKTISLLVLVSAALHVAVLGLVSFNSPSKIVAGSIMRVSIQAPSPTAIPNQAVNNNNKTKPPSKNDVVKEISKPNPKPLVKKATETRKTVPVKTVAIQAPQQESNPVEQQTVVAKLELNTQASTLSLPERTSSLLHSNLERAFALHFYYPRIAIKRGWQGVVKISLRIEADGYLSQVRLLNSSGYNLLDKAAMTSIDKIDTLPAAVALLDGQSLDLVLPVKFHLL